LHWVGGIRSTGSLQIDSGSSSNLFFLQKAKEGRPRSDGRQTINGILYVLTTGCGRMDRPKKYGPKSTVHDRLKDWEKLGVWKKIMDAIISSEYIQGKLSIDKVAIDSTDVAAKKGEKR
jgi:transposase